MAYVGNPGSNKIITTDASGKLVPGTAGSGLNLSSGSLIARTTIAFDCDFTLLSNLSITGATSITDQASRSLTFTPSFAGTASASITNGSGLELTTASNGARSRLRTPFSGFNRLPLGKSYRIWIRWNNYTPLGATQNLYTGLEISQDSSVSNTIEHYRHNNYNWYSGASYSISFPTFTSNYDVLVIEQTNGVCSISVGLWSNGWPANLIYFLSSVIAPSFYRNLDLSSGQLQIQFANLGDATSRTMFLRNMLVETWD